MHPAGHFTATALGLLATLAAVPAQPASTTVSATLRWTAPGDDGMVGRAQAYMLRYSTVPITDANFGSATPVAGGPAPRPPGSLETFAVTGLAPSTVYFFAIKTSDDAGNWSVLSNVASFPALMTGVEDPPAALSFWAPWPNPARTSLRCTFTLPGPAMFQVDAFSVDGRHVSHLASGWRPAGRGEVTWDLRDDEGHRVPAGVYLVRARLGGDILTRRVAVVP